MKILNFGSLNIDNVYAMEHFVRPGETVSSLSLQNFAGGKGLNQSVALACAGAKVYHAGAVGEDGEFLVELLRSKGVNTDYIRRTEGKTGHAIIQVEQGGQNCIILYGGSNQQITEQQVEETLAHFEKGDILLLQNEINGNGYIIDKAYEKGMKIAINPSPINEKITELHLEKVTYFIMNEIEGKELTGKEKPDDIIAEMKQRYPASQTVLTLGKAGAVACDGKECCSHGIYQVKVVDTTAAGDTFTGFYLSSVADGLSMQRALELASKASSIAVGIKGAANSIPTMQTVLEADLKLQ